MAGALLLLVSFVGGLLGSALVIRRVDPRRFERDVVVERASRTAAVPGSISFGVREPLAGRRDDDVMTVGVLTRGAGPIPVCTVSARTAARGGVDAPVELRPPIGGEVYLAAPGSDWEVVQTARLGPGEYLAACRSAGDDERQFTVGRVLGEADVRKLAGPLLGFLGLLLVAGGAFLLGGVLLIVGLVRRSKHRRTIEGPGAV